MVASTSRVGVSLSGVHAFSCGKIIVVSGTRASKPSLFRTMLGARPRTRSFRPPVRSSTNPGRSPKLERRARLLSEGRSQAGQWVRVPHLPPQTGASMYQGGDGALQASCGGFDSHLVHQFCSTNGVLGESGVPACLSRKRAKAFTGSNPVHLATVGFPGSLTWKHLARHRRGVSLVGE